MARSEQVLGMLQQSRAFGPARHIQVMIGLLADESGTAVTDTNHLSDMVGMIAYKVDLQLDTLQEMGELAITRAPGGGWAMRLLRGPWLEMPPPDQLQEVPALTAAAD